MSTATVLNSSGTGFLVTNAVLDSDGNSFNVVANALDSDGNAFLIFNTVIQQLNIVGGDGPVETVAMKEEKLIMMVVKHYLKNYI